MKEAFAYVIGLGASVMMPVIFTVLGMLIGIKFSKALKSGLLVGVGFVGLGVVTALLTSSLGPSLKGMMLIFGMHLDTFDMGWPAAASVAYNTAVGAFIIPVCLGVNIGLLLVGATRTINIDLWNYWHYAFVGAIVYFMADKLGWAHPLAWGYFAAIICFVITLVMADLTAKKFQEFYSDMDGISIPQPFCQSFTPFALVMNAALDKVPGVSKCNVDADGFKKKFGLLGEPLFLGIMVGVIIGGLSCLTFAVHRGVPVIENVPADLFEKLKLAGSSIRSFDAPFQINGTEYAKGVYVLIKAGDSIPTVMGDLPKILGLGIIMGAVMELIPRITALFIEGLKPIAEATRELLARKFNGMQLNIGMSPALVIGHPATLVVSILLIPVTIVLAVSLPGNSFLPLASLAGMFYVFPCVLPITKGNILKTFLVGFVALLVGLYFATSLADSFTLAANDVYAASLAKGQPDNAVKIADGFTSGAALDFASALWCWLIYHLTVTLKWIGAALAGLLALGMCAVNWKRIRAMK